MNKIWNFCCSQNWTSSTIRTIFIASNTILGACIGFLIWIILQFLSPDFSSIDWCLCTIGYPGVFGYISSIIYMFNHEDD